MTSDSKSLQPLVARALLKRAVIVVVIGRLLLFTLGDASRAFAAVSPTHFHQGLDDQVLAGKKQRSWGRGWWRRQRVVSEPPFQQSWLPLKGADAALPDALKPAAVRARRVHLALTPQQAQSLKLEDYPGAVSRRNTSDYLTLLVTVTGPALVYYSWQGMNVRAWRKKSASFWSKCLGDLLLRRQERKEHGVNFSVPFSDPSGGFAFSAQPDFQFSGGDRPSQEGVASQLGLTQTTPQQQQPKVAERSATSVWVSVGKKWLQKASSWWIWAWVLPEGWTFESAPGQEGVSWSKQFAGKLSSKLSQILPPLMTGYFVQYVHSSVPRWLRIDRKKLEIAAVYANSHAVQSCRTLGARGVDYFHDSLIQSVALEVSDFAAGLVFLDGRSLEVEDFKRMNQGKQKPLAFVFKKALYCELFDGTSVRLDSLLVDGEVEG